MSARVLPQVHYRRHPMLLLLVLNKCWIGTSSEVIYGVRTMLYDLRISPYKSSSSSCSSSAYILRWMQQLCSHHSNLVSHGSLRCNLDASGGYLRLLKTAHPTSWLQSSDTLPAFIKKLIDSYNGTLLEVIWGLLHLLFCLRMTLFLCYRDRTNKIQSLLDQL